MRKVDKSCEPKDFTKFKRRENPREWKDIDPISSKLKTHMLEEQDNYCPYCEKHITYNINDKTPPNPHIDHIWPQSKFPKKRFDYNNLILSCSSEGSSKKQYTGGFHKDNVFDEKLFINPVTENPMDYVTHSATGDIISIIDNSNNVAYKRAIYTIKLLNLNEKN